MTKLILIIGVVLALAGCGSQTGQIETDLAVSSASAVLWTSVSNADGEEIINTAHYVDTIREHLSGSEERQELEDTASEIASLCFECYLMIQEALDD